MAKELKEYAAFYGLDDLIAELPPPLAGDEVTIRMVQKRLGDGTTYLTAQKRIAEWVKTGRLEPVGKRLVHGREADAWKVVKR